MGVGGCCLIDIEPWFYDSCYASAKPKSRGRTSASPGGTRKKAARRAAVRRSPWPLASVKTASEQIRIRHLMTNRRGTKQCQAWECRRFKGSTPPFKRKTRPCKKINRCEY